jgi:hypothetical protein
VIATRVSRRWLANGVIEVTLFAAMHLVSFWQILLQKAADWGFRNRSPNFDC